jgi:hypothetical protein
VGAEHHAPDARRGNDVVERLNDSAEDLTQLVQDHPARPMVPTRPTGRVCVSAVTSALSEGIAEGRPQFLHRATSGPVGPALRVPNGPDIDSHPPSQLPLSQPQPQPGGPDSAR